MFSAADILILRKMNYLAHAYLSFYHAETLVGHMISDFVKGRQKDDYEPAIKTGIMLHRAIDHFTDNHPATKLAKQYFRPVYGLYAGAFMDIVYDHFLATDEKIFTNDSLMAFTEETYVILDQYYPVLPERFKAMLPYMKKHNWLYHYHTKLGIQNSFRGLVHRAAYMSESDSAFAVFENNYTAMREQYQVFFPQLSEFAWSYFQSPFPYPV
jgi:acyl carrier protein phosphodiesterase